MRAKAEDGTHTLMKGDEVVEVREITTYLGGFTAIGDCYSKSFNLLGI